MDKIAVIYIYRNFYQYNVVHYGSSETISKIYGSKKFLYNVNVSMSNKKINLYTKTFSINSVNAKQ